MDNVQNTQSTAGLSIIYSAGVGPKIGRLPIQGFPTSPKPSRMRKNQRSKKKLYLRNDVHVTGCTGSATSPDDSER